MRGFISTALVFFLVAFIGETVVSPLIAINGIAPDFSIIALIILSLAAGPVPATIGGFVVGLVQDLTQPTLLGVRALCKCGVGFGLGTLRGRLVHGVPVVEATMIALAVLAHDLVFLLFQSRLMDESFLMPLVTRSLPVAVYSGVVGVPLLRLVEMAGLLGPED
jgi:rod shape-determining protein MreD